MTKVLILMAVQGLIGALDNIWHHEITEKLTSRPAARRELALHTIREFLYGPIFIALAWASWHGAWAALLITLMLVEVVVTLWDFVIEDQTRKLPKFERILHTVLAMNFGAILALFAPYLWDWLHQPTQIVPANFGLLSWLLTAYGVGVFAWAIYDLFAVIRLGLPDWKRYPIRAGTKTNPKHILITGATGFVGRSLTRTLIERGDKPILYVRDMDKAHYIFGPHVAVIDNLDALAHTAHIDAVINLAGEPLLGGLWTGARKRKLVASRVDTTENLIALIERLIHRPDVLINGSAIGYYGLRGDEDISEQDGPQNIFMSELCKTWEETALKAEALGVRIVRLRIGMVFGRDGGAFPRLALPVKFGLGAVFGKGTQWLSWIHKRDLIRLILFAMDDREVSGALNATSPEPVTNRHFTKTLGAHLKRPVWLRMPGFMLDTALGELAGLFTGGQKVLPQETTRLGFTYDFPTLAHALDELIGTAPTEPTPSCDIYYNDDCPVCDAEINHYRKHAQAGDIALRFHRLSVDQEQLRAFHLTQDDLIRRLYIEDENGVLKGGVDAFITIWGALPKYRWLSRLIRMPLIYALANVLYDGVMAPALYHWNRRRQPAKPKAPHAKRRICYEEPDKHIDVV